jgi:hypothetical protein
MVKGKTTISKLHVVLRYLSNLRKCASEYATKKKSEINTFNVEKLHHSASSSFRYSVLA